MLTLKELKASISNREITLEILLVLTTVRCLKLTKILVQCPPLHISSFMLSSLRRKKCHHQRQSQRCLWWLPITFYFPFIILLCFFFWFKKFQESNCRQWRWIRKTKKKWWNKTSPQSFKINLFPSNVLQNVPQCFKRS